MIKRITPTDGDVRIVRYLCVFPIILGNYTCGWFNRVTIKQVFKKAKYADESDGWTNQWFIDEKGKELTD